jgi:hypothetical protein
VSNRRRAIGIATDGARCGRPQRGTNRIGQTPMKQLVERLAQVPE